MKKSTKITQLLLIVGIILIGAAVIMTVLPMISEKTAVAKNKEIISKIYSIIPEVSAGTVDDRVDMDMPSLEIDGEDFVAIIGVPKFGVELPVYGAWDKSKVSRFPCRYTGSIYDKSLIIGGSDAEGQLDFSKTVSIGDSVFVTDMTGKRYSYTVTWVQSTDDVSSDALMGTEGDLVLFIKNSGSLDYTVITCMRK